MRSLLLLLSLALLLSVNACASGSHKHKTDSMICLLFCARTTVEYEGTRTGSDVGADAGGKCDRVDCTVPADRKDPQSVSTK